METYVSITKGAKADVYEEILPQISSLLDSSAGSIANMANVTAVLKLAFPRQISWVGFYLVSGNELLLGPFQGKPACIRIGWGKGVCGTAAQRAETLIVSDVNEFPGHIACDPDSRSEIVVPVFRDGKVAGVLDVDSTTLKAFDDVDRKYLERIARLINVE